MEYSINERILGIFNKVTSKLLTILMRRKISKVSSVLALVVVVALVVEQRHSVWAGQVRILGWI